MMTTADKVKPGDQIRLQFNKYNINGFFPVRRIEVPREGVVSILTPSLTSDDLQRYTRSDFPSSYPVEFEIGIADGQKQEPEI